MTKAVIQHYGQECHLRLIGCTYVATTRDHLIPLAAGGEDTIENCRPACRPCNSRRQDRAVGGLGARIVILCGPPAGGKTTYIREHAQPADVTIDMDKIARALMPNPPDQTHVYPPHIVNLAARARNAAIAQAKRLYTPCTVWLIDAIPNAERLAEYRAARWPIMVIDPGRAVVEARARAERPDRSLAVVAEWYDLHAVHVHAAAQAAPYSTPEAMAEALDSLPVVAQPEPPSLAKSSRAW